MKSFQALFVIVVVIMNVFYQRKIEAIDGMTGNYLYDHRSTQLESNGASFIFYEPGKIIGYQSRDSVERRLVFIEDSVGQKFVLKCYDDDHKQEALCEYLGSLIGLTVGVPINKVRIVRGGFFLEEINNGTALATLHTYVPGKELCKWFEVAANGIILKGGLISERHLSCLSISDDLCDIIALDIFLNNKDRHHENCFFDEEGMRYYAIDMGDIFLSVRYFPNNESDISIDTYQEVLEVACQDQIIACDTYHFLKSLSGQVLTSRQIHSLKRVQSTLRKLILLYPAETIFNMWLDKTELLNCGYTEYKKSYLRVFLYHNMCWVNKVIEVLRALIGG